MKPTMTKDFACSCGELLIKSMPDGSKLRGKVLLVKNGCLQSVCKSCGTTVDLPVTVQDKVTTAPKLVISRKKVVDM